MSQPLLEGHQEYVDSNQEISRLRAEIADLKRRLSHAEIDAKHAKEDAIAAVSNLRRQLLPLFQALKDVFGEIDRVAPGEEAVTTVDPMNASKKAAWDNWKNKLGKPCAKIIDALMTHGSLTNTQLSVITGIHSSNVSKNIYKINKAGLMNKNGNVFSLKQI